MQLHVKYEKKIDLVFNLKKNFCGAVENDTNILTNENLRNPRFEKFLL